MEIIDGITRVVHAKSFTHRGTVVFVDEFENRVLSCAKINDHTVVLMETDRKTFDLLKNSGDFDIYQDESKAYFAIAVKESLRYMN